MKKIPKIRILDLCC